MKTKLTASMGPIYPMTVCLMRGCGGKWEKVLKIGGRLTSKIGGRWDQSDIDGRWVLKIGRKWEVGSRNRWNMGG